MEGKVNKKSSEIEENRPAEDTYTIDELIKAHKALDASYEIVAVALKLSGKKTATVEEAKSIIANFKTQEVK